MQGETVRVMVGAVSEARGLLIGDPYILFDGEVDIARYIFGKKTSEVEYECVGGMDRMFFEDSDGGVTFSGGEPLMQAGFLAKMLIKCREAGLHTAVDTSAYADADTFLFIAGLTYMLLFDLKSADEDLHLKYTGAGTALILQNLQSLSGHPVKLIIRIPVIPGFNDSRKHMAGICDVLTSNNITMNYIELLPYHRLGRQKYQALGMPVPDAPENNPDADALSSLKEVFLQSGFEVK
jgi:pyruvate formate lyase activating enzyme